MSEGNDPERNAPTSEGPSPSKLVKYRVIIGPNIGIYARIIREEKKAARKYYLISTIINIAFLGQIIVAAVLTALSASDASRIAITVLGSLNTVIAGIQTYLKGQGLPNRIRQYEFGLRKLREFIEDRERDFSDEKCALDVDHVIDDVEAMYQAVRQTAEDNTPDNYLPMEGAGKKLLAPKDVSSGSLGPSSGRAANPAPAPDIGTQMDGTTGAERDEEDNRKGKGKEETAQKAGPSETSPNQEDETEEAPLLQERRDEQ